MFELPDAKRVRREDLYDTSSRGTTPSTGADADDTSALRARLNAQLSSRLCLGVPDLVESTTGHPHPHPAVNAPAEAPEQDKNPPGHAAASAGPDSNRPQEFLFRLFSSSAPGQTVVIRPAGGDSRGGGILSGRPLSHYVRAELTPEERGRFASAAVSGAEVLRRARGRAWGLELPWRVTRIAITVSEGKRHFEYAGGLGMRALGLLEPRSATDGGADGKGPAATMKTKKKRARPSKKQRIAHRIRDKARKQREAEAEAQKVTKEEHLRQKKKRLNREKKLKRRQKARDEKEARGGGETGHSTANPTSAGRPDYSSR